MKWLKHSTGSHDDPDISDAMDLFGDAGYTVFFITLEIYGQEFSHLEDGFLTISKTFLRRKLRKSWTKVEQILNFYSKKKRMVIKIDGEMVCIKVPKYIDISSNWTKREGTKKDALPTEVPTEAPTAKEEEVEEEVDKEKKYNDGFLEFYSHFPIKKGKQAAYKAWKKQKPDLQFLTICLLAIKSQKAEKKRLKENSEFCPEWKHPATWLNAGCWEDEPAGPRYFDPGFPKQPEGEAKI